MAPSPAPPGHQRLASLLAATASLLLLVFALAVALPLLPLQLLDPFWQLAFTGTLCSNGYLALLAVLLLNLAAAFDAEPEWLQGRRQLVPGRYELQQAGGDTRAGRACWVGRRCRCRAACGCCCW